MLSYSWLSSSFFFPSRHATLVQLSSLPVCIFLRKKPVTLHPLMRVETTVCFACHGLFLGHACFSNTVKPKWILSFSYSLLSLIAQWKGEPERSKLFPCLCAVSVFGSCFFFFSLSCFLPFLVTFFFFVCCLLVSSFNVHNHLFFFSFRCFSGTSFFFFASISVLLCIIFWLGIFFLLIAFWFPLQRVTRKYSPFCCCFYFFASHVKRSIRRVLEPL